MEQNLPKSGNELSKVKWCLVSEKLDFVHL